MSAPTAARKPKQMTNQYSLKPASFAVDTHMTLLRAARRKELQRASSECRSAKAMPAGTQLTLLAIASITTTLVLR